jgi:5,10-methylenetetrahydrofolate reductase
MDGAKGMNVPVIAGYIVLKSGDMARRLNATLPGVHVPESLIEELDGASDKAAKSIELAGRTIAELRTQSAGVHIMAIGWEARIPELLANAGIVERAAP